MWLFALLLLASVVFGLTLWRAPLRVNDTLIRLRLFCAGIHSRYIRIDGDRIHYLEGGAGPPVVLIHGLASRARQDWSKLAPVLVRSGCHIYALDLPGFGESDKPAHRTYSISEQARFVASFLDALRLDGTILGGFSMGGWIASMVALDQPRRITRLMLFDSAGLAFTPSFDPLLFTPQSGDEVEQFLLLVGAPSHLPGFVKADFVRMTRRNGWVVRRVWDSIASGADFLDSRFSELRMPMLIVWGKEDRTIPVSHGESMHQAAPQSVLQTYDGCGHIALVTCAARIAPAMLAFLQGTDTAAALSAKSRHTN
jgi:pimeloyl-ACP methyl ester carboxylesterase